MNYADYNRGTPTFDEYYRCYSLSFIGKPDIKEGNRSVIMPASALQRLVSLNINYPMMFQINSPSSSRVSHCGVLEFVADEGSMYLPHWMMQNMVLEEGDVLRVKSASLSKGRYVKLQPHSKDFLDLSDPRAVLEMAFRNYSCLTTGDTIMVAYNGKEFYIDVVETKPSSGISIVETDCEVDFAPPLDYAEPEKKPIMSSSPNTRLPSVIQDEPASKTTKIAPFVGAPRRLDGKPSIKSTEPRVSPLPLLQKHVSGTSNSSSAYSALSAASQKRSGTLVFGSNAARATTKESIQETPQRVAEEPKFKAFSGRKYTLK